MASHLRLASLENLPNVWRAPELAHVQERTLSTGHPTLDSLLPGGGWPVGSLVEILQERAGAHAWQLLLPALVQSCKEQPGPVVLVQPPVIPFAPAIEAQGLPGERLMLLQAGKPQASLWASEQALRCNEVAGVMAWLPNARPADLLRLHLAAAQHDRLLFVFRRTSCAQEASPARLRLLLEEAGELKVRILKRRGPPVEESLTLATHPPRLAALLASRQSKEVQPPTLSKDRSHVLDRTVSFA